ncbi:MULTISPECIES: hypothetical protein [unclassified Bradyrhizobium]|uniref:hypothetical protein n=1 Tax=unclassified Bradyrhizobium TaxID=2631580 RepID=UPI0020125A8B|nr:MULTISPECIES: hypothetical protein [unclassified Bradyrhizobium]
MEWQTSRMAKDRDPLADITADDSQGLLTNILADERESGWQMLWRLGSWAVCAVGALAGAFYAVQMSSGLQREQVAAIDVVRQSQQLQAVARESQTEARRLAAAIATLNGDRDRLYARVTVLEQGLDSVTGSVARQAPPASLVLSSATQALSTPPMIAAPTVTAATEPPPSVAETPSAPPPGPPEHATSHPTSAAVREPSLPASTIYAPPDPAAQRLTEIIPADKVAPGRGADKPTEPAVADRAAPKPPEPVPAAATAMPKEADKTQPVFLAALPAIKPTAAQGVDMPALRTEFGVDLGGANSIDGLRALWRGHIAHKESPVAGLRPIIVLKERHNGLGMQLRLVAGPLGDAAAAARICAMLAAANRPCETAIFDGQRLAMSNGATEATPPPVRPRRRVVATPPARPARHDAPLPQPPVEAAAPPSPPAQAPATPSLSSSVSGLFRSR